MERPDLTAGGAVPLPTLEELEMIRDAVLLPLLLTIVDKNGRAIRTGPPLALQRLYARAGNALMKLIHDDLAAVRRELRSRDIRIIREEKTASHVQCRYRCRGYLDEFGMMRDVVRAEIGVRLAGYIEKLFR